jgi:hypothetical protein
MAIECAYREGWTEGISRNVGKEVYMGGNDTTHF